MRQEHLTPDGWKPCTATTKECKYEERRIADASAFIDSAVEAVQTGKPNAFKNFFNSLCGSVKTPSSKLESIKKVPVEIEPTYIDEVVQESEDDDDEEGLNKVVQGEDGQYQIVCRSVRHHDLPITHKFGDFIKNKSTAEILHEADRHKQYQLGWCGPLAEGLLDNNEHVAGYYIFKTEKEPVIGEHHFVKLKDGTYADSLGIWTEEALFSTWKAKHPTAELSSLDPKSPDYKKLKVDINVDITEQDIFFVVEELIDKHMNGKTL